MAVAGEASPFMHVAAFSCTFAPLSCRISKYLSDITLGYLHGIIILLLGKYELEGLFPAESPRLQISFT